MRKVDMAFPTLVIGARQLVVQDAFDITSGPPFTYSSWFTPMTYMGVASLGGAEMKTFLAPPGYHRRSLGVLPKLK